MSPGTKSFTFDDVTFIISLYFYDFSPFTRRCEMKSHQVTSGSRSVLCCCIVSVADETLFSDMMCLQYSHNMIRWVIMIYEATLSCILWAWNVCLARRVLIYVSGIGESSGGGKKGWASFNSWFEDNLSAFSWHALLFVFLSLGDFLLFLIVFFWEYCRSFCFRVIIISIAWSLHLFVYGLLPMIVSFRCSTCQDWWLFWFRWAKHIWADIFHMIPVGHWEQSLTLAEPMTH